MDEKQYLKMRAKADEEYKKNLEAIDRVWHMSHPDKAPPQPKGSTSASYLPPSDTLASPRSGMSSNGSKPFVLSEAVKEAIAEHPEFADISQPIILQKLVARYPEIKPRIQKDQIKAQIAGMLSRMVKSEDLRRIREHHGSEPAVFRKVPTITM